MKPKMKFIPAVGTDKIREMNAYEKKGLYDP
jgi:hypothetical protein